MYGDFLDTSCVRLTTGCQLGTRGCLGPAPTGAAVATWKAQAHATAVQFGLDPLLVEALIDLETGGEWRAWQTGCSMEVGLMQIIPSTAQGIGYNGPVGDPTMLTGLYDPAVNCAWGCYYLRDQVRSAQAKGLPIDCAVAGYNSGRVVPMDQEPYSSQVYAQKIMARRSRLAFLQVAVPGAVAAGLVAMTRGFPVLV